MSESNQDDKDSTIDVSKGEEGVENPTPRRAPLVPTTEILKGYYAGEPEKLPQMGLTAKTRKRIKDTTK